MQQQNKFIVVREDLLQDPVTIISEGLLIGRLTECELLLNHPSVSRVQAGIKQIEGEYYVFNLRPSNPIKLNARPMLDNQALGAGDFLEAGPFLLEIDFADDAVIVKVSLQIGRRVHDADVSSPALGTTRLDDLDAVLAGAAKKKAARPAPLPGTKALDIFWDKRIREAGKMVRPAPLFPHGQRKTGKAQFNWTPTSDLSERWPVSFLIWGVLIVAVFSIGGALLYANAYSPAPLSNAHATSKLIVQPPIAVRANDNSCTNCHSFAGNMESNCAACHKASWFEATVIPPHVAAGIGCTACHAEHKGTDFKPGETALAACTQCHSDSNKTTYNGKKVSTPHNGTFGYPTVNGKWTWKGLDNSEWALRNLTVTRLPAESEEQWRSKQFHALHVHRVKLVGSLAGNPSGRLSCSSCHKSFNRIDRDTPRQTCAGCHNGRTEAGTGRVLIAADKPNCTSCHVQHIKDPRHWNPSLLAKAF
ncbi:MAG TPA: FHA domain-containing protein [Pyrinomonadaceae bacterium]|nr:FHA domain-containing protein [Pyrinomonadaceae bacterium]